MIQTLSTKTKSIITIILKILLSISCLSIPFKTIKTISILPTYDFDIINESYSKSGTTTYSYQITNYILNDRSTLRIYRGIAEICLMIICSSICLYVLEKNLSVYMVRVLIFGEVDDNDDGKELFGFDENNGIVYRLDKDDEEEDITTTSRMEQYSDKKYSDNDDEKKKYLDDKGFVLDVEKDDDDEKDSDDGKEDSDRDEEDVKLISSDSLKTVKTSNVTKQVESSSIIPLNVANAGMDIILLLSISLLLYTKSKMNQESQDNSNNISNNNRRPLSFLLSVNPSLYPLLLIFIFIFISIFPFQTSRKNFWLVVFRTIEAPLASVTFRDGLIGDIFTSSVRPLQDLSYSFFYLLSGLDPNMVKSIIDTRASSEWILYTFVLPACTVSPLWWRFLQNLRQAYDYRKRWPYLGNAFKYFIAAEVALFGLFVPKNKNSFIWISCFVIATLYQIWWDTFMDWELFHVSSSTTTSSTTKSRILNFFTLRKTRLYKYKILYYFIFGINVLLRFCWTLSFIPPHTLSRAGLLIPTFSNDADLLFKNIIHPALASAEIIRRTLWTLLRVELQAIKKIKESSNKASNITNNEDDDDNEASNKNDDVVYDKFDDLNDMMPMSIETTTDDSSYSTATTRTMLQSIQPFSIFQTSFAVNTEVQVLTELALWATAFASLGIIAAAHRE